MLRLHDRESNLWGEGRGDVKIGEEEGHEIMMVEKTAARNLGQTTCGSSREGA